MKLKFVVAAVLIILAAILVIVFVYPGVRNGDPQVTTEPSIMQTDPTVTIPPADDDNAEIHLGQELYIVHVGNYSGNYVEDGSDAEVKSVAAVIVENRGQQTVQLVEFQLSSGEDTYSFSLTTLPPGTRVMAQELAKQSFADEDAEFDAKMDAIAFFQEEPSLYEDVFAVTGMENGVELRNLTDSDIAGPIYVYYKTVTSEGFLGGITYRVLIEELKAGETYQAYTNHFRSGISQVMFITYVQN